MEEIWLLARMRDRRRVAVEDEVNPMVRCQPTDAHRGSFPPPSTGSSLTKRKVGDRRQSVVAHVQAIVPTLERSQVLNGSDPKPCDRSVQNQAERKPRRVTSHKTAAEGWGYVSFQTKDEEQELASFQEHRSSSSRRVDRRKETDLETPTLAPSED